MLRGGRVNRFKEGQEVIALESLPNHRPPIKRGEKYTLSTWNRDNLWQHTDYTGDTGIKNFRGEETYVIKGYSRATPARFFKAVPKYKISLGD